LEDQYFVHIFVLLNKVVTSHILRGWLDLTAGRNGM